MPNPPPRFPRPRLAVDVFIAARADRIAAERRFAIQTFAGIGTGLAIILLIDRLIGGPGLLAAFGL